MSLYLSNYTDADLSSSFLRTVRKHAFEAAYGNSMLFLYLRASKAVSNFLVVDENTQMIPCYLDMLQNLGYKTIIKKESGKDVQNILVRNEFLRCKLKNKKQGIKLTAESFDFRRVRTFLFILYTSKNTSF
mmetsp:Transcript_345/g.404  ORF Transcript_345/g.404 Transcript_345/m.404 type:complete len:131 (+) Transcript_345:98-490(+)